MLNITGLQFCVLIWVCVYLSISRSAFFNTASHRHLWWAHHLLFRWKHPLLISKHCWYATLIVLLNASWYERLTLWLSICVYCTRSFHWDHWGQGLLVFSVKVFVYLFLLVVVLCNRALGGRGGTELLAFKLFLYAGQSTGERARLRAVHDLRTETCYVLNSSFILLV